MIHAEFDRLSPLFKYEPTSSDVEGGFIKGLHKKPEDLNLDYRVLHEGKHIASMDVTASNYTFETSRVMPVAAYKGLQIKESSVPVFLVYNMERESLPLSERCVWIKGEDVIKCNVQFDDWEKGGYNYHTNKADWHRGLKTLIEEFKKLITS